MAVIPIKSLLCAFLMVIVCNKSPVTSTSDKYSLETKFIEVPVNHYAASPTSRTFKLRYLVNLKNFVRGGPIFIYTGGNEDITEISQNVGFIFDIASSFKAALIFIEHRYYGDSLPFGNASFSSIENLKYLSTPQTLADLAYVIKIIKNDFLKGHDDTSKVITIGGYYGGMLAVWLRMKYPFIVDAAMATSSPLLYFPGYTSCEGYYGRVTWMFEKYGRDQCIKTIKLGWDIIINLSKSKLGLDFMSSTWKLCRRLKEPEDVGRLLDWLANVYVKLSLINYHYPSNYLADVPAYPVKVFCDKLTTSYFNDTRGFVETFGKALEIFTNYTGTTKCNNIHSSENDHNEVAFRYQTCTELVQPKCSTDDDMFITKPWNYDQFALDCYNKFGVRPMRTDWVTTMYGGRDWKYYKNIMVSNNLVDALSWGSATANNTIHVKNDILFYTMRDSPHLMDFREANTADNNHIIHARNYYVKVLEKWLNQK